MKINEFAGMRGIPAFSRACTLCATLALLVSSPAIAAGTLEKVAQKGSITLGYQLAPPFSYLDEAGNVIGYSIDVCQKVVEAVKHELKRPDLVVKYAPVTSITRFPALIDGEIDLECANTPSTAESRKKVAFTIPTFMAVTRLMVRENGNIKTIYDLKDKTAVTIWGSNMEKTFDQMNSKLTLRASNLIANDLDGALSVMETNAADAFIMDDVLLKLMQAASKNKTKYVITKGDLAIQPLSLMLRKDDPEFKKLVDAEVTRVITKGEIYPMYKKWFESPIPPNQLNPMYTQWADMMKQTTPINLNLPMVYMLRDSFKVPTDWVPEF